MLAQCVCICRNRILYSSLCFHCIVSIITRSWVLYHPVSHKHFRIMKEQTKVVLQRGFHIFTLPLGPPLVLLHAFESEGLGEGITSFQLDTTTHTALENISEPDQSSKTLVSCTEPKPQKEVSNPPMCLQHEFPICPKALHRIESLVENHNNNNSLPSVTSGKHLQGNPPL